MFFEENMSKVLIVFLALLSLLALLTGCAQTSVSPTTSSSGYPAPTSSGNPTAESGYPPPAATTAASTSQEGIAYPAGSAGTVSIAVVASNGTIKDVSMADLNDLPKATIGNDSGPKLIDVLQLANIFDFTSVTITGSNGSKDLTKDQVTDQVILGLANNSASLIIGGASSDQEIKDVNTLKVK
jgi:hypothetical protein